MELKHLRSTPLFKHKLKTFFIYWWAPELNCKLNWPCNAALVSCRCRRRARNTVCVVLICISNSASCRLLYHGWRTVTSDYRFETSPRVIFPPNFCENQLSVFLRSLILLTYKQTNKPTNVDENITLAEVITVVISYHYLLILNSLSVFA